MKHIFNPYINELRGYLKCIAQLCAKDYSFGVAAYDADKDIDTFVAEIVEYWGREGKYIKPSKYDYFGFKQIESTCLFKEIEGFIFNGLLDRKNMPSENAKSYAKKILTEDINEYYGLVSVSLNKDGVFHPLLSSKVYRLEIKHKSHKRALYFLVKIESVYVITFFLEKAKHQYQYNKSLQRTSR